MKKVVKRVLVLGIIGVFSGFVLAVAYNYAKPKIQKNKQQAKRKAIYNILPSTETYEVENINGRKIYFCYKDGKKLSGYAFETSGMGYQGEIVMMVGLHKNLKTLKGIEILKHSETPGLGANIVKKSFKKQFEGLKIYPSIEYTTKEPPKKKNQIQAITGATVTSSSVVEILNNRLDRVIKILKNYHGKN